MTGVRAGRVPVSVKRTFALLVAVIGTAALLSGCGGAAAPVAAKVGSATISRTTLDDELSELANNPRWIAAVQQNFSGALTAPDGGISAQLSSAWLNTLVNQEIVDQAYEKRHLKVTPEQRAQAKTAVSGLLAGTQTIQKFSPWFRDLVLHRQERYAAVAASVPPLPAPTETQLREYFSRIGSQLCPTNVAILMIQVATAPEADAIEAELAAGADFATLAGQRSTHSQSATSGGLVACKDTPQYSQLPETLRSAVGPLASGSVSQPVATGTGVQIFKVVPWSYDVAHGVLSQLWVQQHASAIEEFVNASLVRTKVWIDPRYGTVVRRGGTVVIHPPKAPTPRSDPVLPPSTTTPAAATSP
jgi:parvulin-like peptidyl-prolyl isomerase